MTLRTPRLRKLTLSQIVQRMCIAGIEAEASEDPDSESHKRFRAFLYLIMRVCIHELGHIFITFLTSGLSNTPPEMFPRVKGQSKPKDGKPGEAGSYLEVLIFDGDLTVGIDADADKDSQVYQCLPSVNEH